MLFRIIHAVQESKENSVDKSVGKSVGKLQPSRTKRKSEKRKSWSLIISSFNQEKEENGFSLSLQLYFCVWREKEEIQGPPYV
jgi:hypothetical protein